jgi:hypothetical protein
VSILETKPTLSVFLLLIAASIGNALNSFSWRDHQSPPEESGRDVATAAATKKYVHCTVMHTA